MAVTRASAVVLLFALVAATWSSASSADATSPRLTRNVPGVVQFWCKAGTETAPIPIVCPPLVPVTQYLRHPGLNGILLGNSGPRPPKSPQNRLYLLGFNGGFSGPTYWHWIAGMGTPEAIQYWVLSDVRNEVRGKPKRVRVVAVDGQRVDIWRFPDHPAGGQFGGHYAAITTTGRLLAIASIHGDNADGSARMAVALARKAVRKGG